MVSALGNAVKQGWIAEEEITPAALERFLSKNGREFYGIYKKKLIVGRKETKIRLESKGNKIPARLSSEDGNVVIVPFMAGRDIYSTTWIEGEDE